MKPMRIGHLNPTGRDERYWEAFSSGEPVSRIAAREGCEEQVVANVIRSIWERDRRYFLDLEARVRRSKKRGRG